MSKLLKEPSTDYLLCWFDVFVVEIIISKSFAFYICNGTATFASD